MVTRKNTAEGLKAKMDKLENDLVKVKDQKAQLNIKEKELTKSLKEAKASYIVALMAESGKSIEELEQFAKNPHQEKNGDELDVSGYEHTNG